MRFCLADESHDGALRRLVREQPMPGWVRLAFACEPHWADAHAVLGDFAQTLVGTNAEGEVAGCGVRAIRRVFLNGEAGTIGYLAGLRSVPNARGSFGLVQGFRFLRRLHDADGFARAYLTTIIEENRAAQELLTSGRAGLPTYRDQGRVFSSAIFLGGRGRPRDFRSGWEIRTGREVPMPAILSFLKKEGRAKQFFPIIEEGDWGTAPWRGLSPENFRVVLCHGKILGLAAAWDQSAFRQTVVSGYAQPLRTLRPFINAILALRGRRALPKPGCALPFFHLALTCISQDDPEVFAALLERFREDWRHSACSCFVVSLHEANPLRAGLQRFYPLEYASRLYLVNWPEGEPFVDALDKARVPHVESGLL